MLWKCDDKIIIHRENEIIIILFMVNCTHGVRQVHLEFYSSKMLSSQMGGHV